MNVGLVLGPGLSSDSGHVKLQVSIGYMHVTYGPYMIRCAIF